MSVERGNAACGVVCLSVSVVDKLHHIPGDLHLHSAGSLAADARVERVVRRRLHGRTRA